ncbi:MAG TPA: NADH-quinone oxidoreductase subunit A [Syntrophales bacterium]|jgi:NADH-quinone oxidoreductase subunit A|nr:NADH-quinone oxidoreductase subunit A [Syntrophales bacterium]HRT60819.1 NADH-quinone oxidoreductase subunit A [Syntrophales bacterium]
MPDNRTVQALWPLAVYVATVVFVAAAMIGLSYLLGEKHEGRATGQPYESGVVPTGEAWIRFDVKYYLVAMFFVIFDIESVFIFAWAVVAREAGWGAYLAIAVFIGVLLVALGYLWRMGGLDWGGLRRKQATPPTVRSP